MTRGTRTIGILLVLAVAGYLVYAQVIKWHQRTLESSQEQSEAAWQTEG